MKRTLALQSCLTLFFLLFLGFLLLLLNIITFSFEKWLTLRSKKQILIYFGCDAVLFELNKTSCCLARMCALVHLLLHGSCMLSFAKVFQFLILRLIGKCAVLSLIANPLPFSFSISDMNCGKEYSALGMFVMQVLLGFCIVDANFWL